MEKPRISSLSMYLRREEKTLEKVMGALAENRNNQDEEFRLPKKRIPIYMLAWKLTQNMQKVARRSTKRVFMKLQKNTCLPRDHA